jgi:hypothetical protein
VRIRAFGPSAAVTVVRPAIGPGPGWRAPRYGVLERGTAVRVASPRLSPSDRLVTIVEAISPGAVPSPVEVAAEGGELQVRVGDAILRFERDGSVRCEGAAGAAKGVS